MMLDRIEREDWDAIEPWSCYLGMSVLHDTAIPRGIDVPVLYQVSELDDLVAADVTRDDFPVLCEQGYRMEYLECAGASHTDGAVMSLPFQFDWVAARLAGEEIEQPCVMTEPVDCAEFGLLPE